MSRPAGIQLENKFVKGLITENTAIAFPTDAVTEVDNCVFDYTGRITRRLGIDLEGNYSTTNTFTPVTGEAWNEFLWRNVSGDQAQSFFVQQRGETILFFDVTSSTEIGTNVVATTIDLTDYIPTGSSNEPGLVVCQFAQGHGNLIITNEYTDPLLVEYDVAGELFTVSTITVQARDFEGVDDGLALTTRPTSTVAALATNNPEHYYNILNQGWSLTDALSQWDASETTVPSNADMVAYFRSDAGDAFGPSRILAKSAGNTPAVKGHFILNVGENDRTAALLDGGFSATITGGSALIPAADGTIIGDFGVDGSAAFDDDTSEPAVDCALLTANNGYIGKDWGASTTHTLGRVLVCGSNNNGLATGYSGDIVLAIYGKNGAAPANSTDGTLIGTLTVTDVSAPLNFKHSVECTDTTTAYRYHWVRLERTTPASTDWAVAEVQFYEVGSSFVRPRCVSFFAGRAWYAGVDTAAESSVIFFSQIIQSDDMYGKCYQKNDPTNEEIADLLDDDGGAIKIPEIGRIERLFPFQAQMLVFASNGVWLIKGGSGGFKATSYEIKRITSVGVFSPLSVTDVRNVPVWWAEDGIYTVTYDPNYDSTTVTSITETTIKTFINDIPSLNRRFVKGTYDRLNDTVYWIFNDTGALGDEDYYSYNRALCFNTKTSAFYPWTFGTDGSNSPTIRGILYVQDGNRADNFLVKYPIEYTEGATTYHSYADVVDDGYKDWVTYDTIISGTQTVDYDSYFITGHRIDAKLIQYFQTNYVFVFLEQETNASCFVQGFWDFSNDNASGKWSTAQQIYNAYTTKGRSYRSVNHRRLKIRGKGKALQLKFYSASGKPFTIIGWGIMETSNASI